MVVILHGKGGTAVNFMNEWKKVAEKYKFAVIALKSKGDDWTDNSEELILDAIKDFKSFCDYNEKRIKKWEVDKGEKNETA